MDIKFRAEKMDDGIQSAFAWYYYSVFCDVSRQKF